MVAKLVQTSKPNQNPTFCELQKVFNKYNIVNVIVETPFSHDNTMPISLPSWQGSPCDNKVH
jgi:hypothetical protein